MSRILGLFFKIIGMLTVVGLLLAAIGLYFAGTWLQADDAPERAEAIVVLAGGLSRPLHAGDLHAAGYAPRVYVGRPADTQNARMLRDLGWDAPLQEDVYAAILERKGVPEADVAFFGRDLLSTAEEAEALREVIGPGPGRLIVVTSPFHVRRAKLIFCDVFPGREILVCATPYEVFPEKWWTSQSSALAVVSETAKTIFYLLGGRFRSTDEGKAEDSMPATFSAPANGQ